MKKTVLTLVALVTSLIAGCGPQILNTYDPCFVATEGQARYSVLCSWTGDSSNVKNCMERKGVRVTETRKPGLSGKPTFYIENPEVSSQEVVKQANIVRACIQESQQRE